MIPSQIELLLWVKNREQGEPISHRFMDIIGHLWRDELVGLGLIETDLDGVLTITAKGQRFVDALAEVMVPE